MNRPAPTEYAAYFEAYISLVPETDVVAALKGQADEVRKVIANFEVAALEELQEPYTWTPKQVLGHCIDTERVMGYRAATFSVSSGADLPGFDQDEFVDKADFNSADVGQLIEEFEACRKSHVLMFERLPESAWAQAGQADGKSISVRALAYLMVGHVRHHLAILRSRSQSA